MRDLEDDIVRPDDLLYSVGATTTHLKRQTHDRTLCGRPAGGQYAPIGNRDPAHLPGLCGNCRRALGGK